jgi:uncharacterized RDD family membrane protein YckC
MTTATEATMLPAADLDRRFYAFVIDRLVAWTVVGAVAWAAYHFLISRGGVGAGFLVIVGVLLLVGLGLAVAQGLTGTSPGKAALGLRPDAARLARPGHVVGRGRRPTPPGGARSH